MHMMGKETVLLRLPMMGEIEEVVRFADISLNSEIQTIRLLDTETPPCMEKMACLAC